MMIVKVGMRNLLRNKRRSILSGFAIGIGLASLILFDGFWLGMMNNMVSSVTKTYLGHIQIHHKSYELKKDSKYFIKNYQEIISNLKSNSNIIAYSPRLLKTAMVNSAYDSSNVQLVGVTPDLEKNISLFSKRILFGNFLEKPDDILIGKRLSELLEVTVGDRIVVTTSQIESGELSQGLFRVGGIFGIGQKTMDEYIVVMHHDKLRSLLGVGDIIHEIAFKVKDLKLIDDYNFLNQFNYSNELNLKTWKDLAPQIVSAINMYDISILVMSVILLSLVSLGILNTLFMSMYERMFEFGVLRAVGTRSSQILLMVMSEAIALALLSISIGIIVALIFGGIMATYGVDYSGVEFAEVTFTEKIYFIFRWQQFIYFPLVIFIFTSLISLYPAVHAVRITMAKALHKSL